METTNQLLAEIRDTVLAGFGEVQGSLEKIYESSNKKRKLDEVAADYTDISAISTPSKTPSTPLLDLTTQDDSLFNFEKNEIVQVKSFKKDEEGNYKCLMNDAKILKDGLGEHLINKIKNKKYNIIKKSIR